MPSLDTIPRLALAEAEASPSGMEIYFADRGEPLGPGQMRLFSCLGAKVAEPHTDIAEGSRITIHCEDSLLEEEIAPAADGNIHAALLDGNGDWLWRLSHKRLDLLRRNLQLTDIAFVHDPRSITQVELFSVTPVHWLGLPAERDDAFSIPVHLNEVGQKQEITVLSPGKDAEGTEFVEALSHSFSTCNFRHITMPEANSVVSENTVCVLVLDDSIRFGLEVLSLAEKGIPVIGPPTLAAMHLLYGELALHPLLETAALKDRICDCLYSPARVCWIMEQARARIINTSSQDAVRRRFSRAVDKITHHQESDK